jgi:hypothetical protein
MLSQHQRYHKPEKIAAKLGLQQMNLAADLLQEGYKVRLEVRGYSMLPLIPTGTTIEIVPIGLEKLQLGDLLLTCYNHRATALGVADAHTPNLIFLIHRLVSIQKKVGENSLITTRGDNNPYFDPILEANTQTVLGKVVAVYKNSNNRRYDYTKKRWRGLNRLLGWTAAAQLRRMPNPNTSPSSFWRIVERKFFSWFFTLLRYRIGQSRFF